MKQKYKKFENGGSTESSNSVVSSHANQKDDDSILLLTNVHKKSKRWFVYSILHFSCKDFNT